MPYFTQLILHNQWRAHVEAQGQVKTQACQIIILNLQIFLWFKTNQIRYHFSRTIKKIQSAPKLA